MNEKSLVQVAKLGRVVGLKGFIKLHNLSDFESQFKKGASFLAPSLNDKKLTIKSYNKLNQTAIFEGFESVELAKSLVNLSIFQSIEMSRKTCKLKKDEFFYFDILKCSVFDAQRKLGEICDIMQSSGGFLLEVKTEPKLLESGLAKSFFIPYIDKFVLRVDIENLAIHCSDEAILILENS